MLQCSRISRPVFRVLLLQNLRDWQASFLVYFIREEYPPLFPLGDVPHCSTEVTSEHFLVKDLGALLLSCVLAGSARPPRR